jgi:hypothetical protein
MLYFVENLLSRFLPIKKTLKMLALLADDCAKLVLSSVFLSSYCYLIIFLTVSSKIIDKILGIVIIIS